MLVNSRKVQVLEKQNAQNFEAETSTVPKRCKGSLRRLAAEHGSATVGKPVCQEDNTNSFHHFNILRSRPRLWRSCQ